MANNDMLMGIALLEKVLPLLNENTRESIRRDSCFSIERNIDLCLGKIIQYTKDNIILMPLIEANQLIKTLLEEDDFKETSAECKDILVDKIHSALDSLYLLAGKWYMTNDFDYTPTIANNIIRIINSCMKQGFYFNYDAQLQAEGKI